MTSREARAQAMGPTSFDSFGDFNVPSNNIANFLNDSGLTTSNILGRVTGGNISNIFGTIQTTGFGNANLFLMNPAGFCLSRLRRSTSGNDDLHQCELPEPCRWRAV
jgi:filamentous hemagglutinin family protein